MRSYDDWKCDSGRETEAWEGPQEPETVVTSCVRCAGDVIVPFEQARDVVWCPACIRKARERRQQRELRGIA